MDGQTSYTEFEQQPDMYVQKPLSEILSDSSEFREFWPEDQDSTELFSQIDMHVARVDTVNQTLDILDTYGGELTDAIDSKKLTPDQAAKFYRILLDTLENTESKRVLLYLPMAVVPDKNWSAENTDLENEVVKFREIYRNSWYELLEQADVRANFVDGDVLEYDRRPEEPERIVKAAHLTPWLVEKGILSKDEVLELAKQTKRFPILKQSFAGALDVMQDMELISKQERAELNISYTADKPLEMTDISPARAAWLANRHRDLEQVFFDENRPVLHGELSANLREFPDELAKIEQDLRRPELARYIYPVAILSGSRLKGYSRDDSDLDVNLFIRPEVDDSEKAELRKMLDAVFEHAPSEFWLTESEDGLKVQNPAEYDARVAESNWAHILLGSAWLGDQAIIREISTRLLPQYFANDAERGLCLQCIENDALRYRLLHKGFARHGQVNSFAAGLPHSAEIDGDSAFYDEAYRRLATRLYFEKVFLPKI